MRAAERVQMMPKVLRAWYHVSKRPLPWRVTRDPYAILVSEVMLQQTQVDRVIPKYKAWLRRWPTGERLAQARHDQVLRLWSGLGYNRRAGWLRATAQKITNDYDGRWPTTYEELRTLPGVGDYTAKALLVFAFRQPVAAIDTNVRRVLGRIFFGQTKPAEKKLVKLAEAIIPARAPDDWHHALMDLGATICRSPRPRCDVCPVKLYCRAYPKIFQTPEIPRSAAAKPFRTTDRFWRGRVIALLVKSSPRTNRTLVPLLRQQGAIATRRFVRIMAQLSRDGLLHQRQGRIYLGSAGN